VSSKILGGKEFRLTRGLSHTPDNLAPLLSSQLNLLPPTRREHICPDVLVVGLLRIRNMSAYLLDHGGVISPLVSD
jgi:hypothetical protein